MYPRLQETYGFSPQDLEAFHAHFKRLDRDGDGHISMNELRTHFKEMGVRVTARTLNDLIYEIDANRNGQVEFEEFVMLMYRMKKGGSTNWKQLLDFTRPLDRNATIARRAGRETLRFLGAMPANEFDHDQQWQDYSFFQRVDVPAQESRAMNVIRNLNPFNRSSSRDENPGPSGSAEAPGQENRAINVIRNLNPFNRSSSKDENPGASSRPPPRVTGITQGREVIEVTVLKDEDDEAAFESDSSYEYYSDSDDEQPQPQAQRLSRVVVASRPLSGIFANPPTPTAAAAPAPPAPVVAPAPVLPTSHVEPSAPPLHDMSSDSSAAVAASSSQLLHSRDSPTVTQRETPEEAEYRVYQQQRQQQLEQHQRIQQNSANQRRALASENARPLSVASADIPLLQLNTGHYSRSSSPAPASPVTVIGGHGGFIDDTDDFIAEAPSPANANPRRFERVSRRPLSQASFEGPRRPLSQASFDGSRPSPPQPSTPQPSAFYPVVPLPTTAPAPTPAELQAHPLPPPTEAVTPPPENRRERRRRRRQQAAQNGTGTTRRRPVEEREQPQRRPKLKHSRGSRVEMILQDPKVRQQLRKRRTYRPYFMLLVILVQLGLMGYALVVNQGFEDMAVNPFAGPSVEIILQLGAKYGPCMRPPTTRVLEEFGVSEFNDLVPCPATFSGTMNGTLCPLNEMLEHMCGMGGFPDGVPMQWWRFFTSIFMHTGLIHLAVIILFQLRIGFPLEQEMGPIRMFFIYILSGVLGNAFAANMSPLGLTCGASGSLFGLFALLFIDLIQNWPILTTPWINLTILLTICFIVLGIGLLPFIDNYAQLGGLAGGLFSGLVFMPTITFGVWDGRRKKILMAIASVLLILLFFAGFYTFYDANETNYCTYCSYLDCVPPEVAWCRGTSGLL